MSPPESKRKIIWTPAAILLCISLASPAHAQSSLAESGAQSLLIDPSVRSSGMGRSSNAVFWGSGPNYWSNPALLAFSRGVEYEWGRTQLVPDLASDVFFTSKRRLWATRESGFWWQGSPSTRWEG